MASVITIAGEQLFAAKAQANEQLDIDTFIFANVPNQDPNAPINREEGIPTANIVYQQNVQQVGRINDNVVVYSTVLDSITGPFEFNWVGLYSSVNQKLVAINHVPTVTKTATAPGAAGNTLNRNFGIEYSGIADLTGINVEPETWQLDFTARLSGMDLLTQQLAADMNGKDWFIDDGLKVVPRTTVNTFSVTPGVGYVSGLRVELKQEHILIVQSYPQFVYVDAWFSGNANSTWSPQLAFTVTNTEIDDYIDPSGTQHYVYKLAVIGEDVANDLRNTTQQVKQDTLNEVTNILTVEAVDWTPSLIIKDKNFKIKYKGSIYFGSSNPSEIPFITGERFKDDGDFWRIDTTPNDPRYYGAKPNDDSFDSLPMLIKARNTGKLELHEGLEYFVSDEFVLTSGLMLITETNCKISAMNSDKWNADKAVVRCSFLPIGETPNVNALEQQIVNLNHSGKLICDAKYLTGYGFYGRAITNESVLDDIEGVHATVSAVSIMQSWFFSVKTRLFGKKSAHNVVLGFPLSGETGDIFINAVNIPQINSYDFKDDTGMDYDPINGDFYKQIDGAGMILGKGLGNSIGNLTSQKSNGAGLATVNPIAWDIQSVYLEGCGKSQNGMKISFIGTDGNTEDHVLNIGQMHLAIGQTVLSKTINEMVHIKNMYRFDPVMSFRNECIANSFKVDNANHYTKLAYNYSKPISVKSESSNIVCFIGDYDVSQWGTKTFSVTKLTKGKVTIILDRAAPSNIQFIISGEGGSDIVQINAGQSGVFEFSLSKTHNTGTRYTVSMGVIASSTCIANIKIQDSNTYW